MRIAIILLSFSIIFLTSCRGKKPQPEAPKVNAKTVEDDFGINEDSILKYQTPPVISDKKKDSLFNKTKDQ